MKLSRELVRRMAGRGESSSSASGGGGGGGGVSPSWVEENYISKAFFSRLFTIHSATGDITPNDTETTVDNIEALAGFWTGQYLSALGQNSGGGGGGSSTLADLLDVALSSPQDGQALVYDADAGKWVNGTVTPDLTDYATKDWVQQQGYLTQHQSLAGYATQSWVQQQGYVTSSALTGYATQQWVQQQGYLTASALAGYATQSWVQQQGYLTSSALTDYATQSWVQQQGYLTSSALTGYATQSWVQQQGYLTSVGFNDLPTMYWANVAVSSTSSTSTTPRFARIGVGTAVNANYPAIVNGTLCCTRIRIGGTSGITMEYDSSNGGLRIVSGGLYADTYITALGTGGSTSGYLPLSGGTMTGNLTLANNIQLRATASNGTDHSVLFVNSNDQLAIGYGLRAVADATTAYYANTEHMFYCGGGSTSTVRAGGFDRDGLLLPNTSSRSLTGRLYCRAGNLYWRYNNGSEVQLT